MFTKEDERQYHSLVAKAWADQAFHKRFVENPAAVLKEAGIHVPDHVDVSVKEGETRGKIVIALPHKPAGVSDDDIKKGNAGPDPCFC